MQQNLDLTERAALDAFSQSTSLSDILLEAGQVTELIANHCFIHQDDLSDDVFLLLSGKARAFLLSLEGREMWIASYRPGDLVGELAVLTGAARSASIVTTAATRCLAFRDKSFQSLLKQHGPLGLRLAQIQAIRLTDTTSAMFSAAIDHIDKRVIRHLTKTAQSNAGSGEFAVVTPVPVISELALELGSSRETVSRAVNKLIKLGMILRQKDHLAIRGYDLPQSGDAD